MNGGKFLYVDKRSDTVDKPLVAEDCFCAQLERSKDQKPRTQLTKVHVHIKPSDVLRTKPIIISVVQHK